MRSLGNWMMLWLVSTLGAALGVPLGFLAALVVYPALGFVAFFLTAFLSLVGMAIGLAPVGAVGGAVAGTIIGSLQSLFVQGDRRYKAKWVTMGILGWAMVGVFTIVTFVPVERSDLVPLVWLTAFGAVMAGAAQGLGSLDRLHWAFPRILICIFGTLSGGLAGVALLGTMTSRGPIDPFQRALTFREFVYRSSATGLTNFNGRLLFFVTAEDAYQEKWWELWESDGTSAGTVPVRRAYTGWNQPSITLEPQFKDMLFFDANGVLDEADAQSWKNSGGQWRTDGTSAGTILLDSYLPDPILLAGDLYFRSGHLEGSLCTLHKVTGSDVSPALVSQLTGVCEAEMAASETTLFFLTREEDASPPACTLWRSDGTAAGTIAIATFEQDLRHDCPSKLLAVNGSLFMIVPTMAESELWISDGTRAGTRPVKKLDGVTEPLSSSSPIQANGIYFVVLADKTEKFALWRSDGTPEGTFRLKPIWAYKLTRLDETVIFVAPSPEVGWDLWRSDGTVGGTTAVSGFFSEARDLAPELVGEIAGDLFWRIQNRETCNLWKSHGTEVGMTLFAPLCPSEWTSINGTLFFIVQKNDFTLELWQSDGTRSGATLIRTIP
jgi:ELWxxDGT repeat protein